MGFPKIELPNVTLAIIDNVNDTGRFAALFSTRECIEFNEVVEITDPIEMPIRSVNDYSEFVFKHLCDYIHTDFCMIIQHDGYVLNPYLWQPEFLGYDYIGAPWWYNDGHNVGNGGFSIRSKRLMMELQDPYYTDLHPEDDRICRKYRPRLEKKGFTFAPEWLAKRFSWEANPKSGPFLNNTFGYHCAGFTLPDL